VNIFELVGFLLITLIVVLACALLRPQRMTCPAGFYVNGVRETGASECIRDSEVPASFGVRIYCTNGTRPIVGNDGRTIGCQRGGL
jgi:hypothetical protein